MLTTLWLLCASLVGGAIWIFLYAFRISRQIKRIARINRLEIDCTSRKFAFWVRRLNRLRVIAKVGAESPEQLVRHFSKPLERDVCQKVYDEWTHHQGDDSVPITDVRQLRLLIMEPAIYFFFDLVVVRKNRLGQWGVKFKLVNFMGKVERRELCNVGLDLGPFGRWIDERYHGAASSASVAGAIDANS